MKHILYLDFIDSASLLKGVGGSDGAGTPGLKRQWQAKNYRIGMDSSSMNEENLFLRSRAVADNIENI